MVDWDCEPQVCQRSTRERLPQLKTQRVENATVGKPNNKARLEVTHTEESAHLTMLTLSLSIYFLLASWCSGVTSLPREAWATAQMCGPRCLSEAAVEVGPLLFTVSRSANKD